MFTKFLWAVLCTCLTINVCSQQTNNFKENKLFSYHKLIQIDEPENKIIALPQKGQKMILDFFSSYCVVCFRMIPKMDTLQQKYKNDIKVLLVGKEDKKIRSIYQRLREKFNLKLSVAFDSAIFSKLKINIVPTYVWIDENGIIKAITSAEEMTDDNVRLFINNKDIVRTKNVRLNEFDPEKLLFVNGNGGDEKNIQYRSLLTEWTQNLPFYIPPGLKTTSETDKFQAVGVTFSELYRYAYFGIAGWNMQHPYYGKIFPIPLLKNSKTNVYIPMISEKRFCYSLYKSNSTLSASSIEKYLRKDLEFYFGYKARIGSCNVSCWKLTVMDAKLLKASKQYKTELNKDPAGFTAFNQPITQILQTIYRYNSSLEIPIIDCTGIKYNIDLNVVATMEDLNDVAKSLALYGLRLAKAEEQMDAIILE